MSQATTTNTPDNSNNKAAVAGAIARKIAFYRQHFSCPSPNTPAYFEPGSVLDEELMRAFDCLAGPVQLPLYIRPADIIDEYGNITRLKPDTPTQPSSHIFGLVAFNGSSKEKLKRFFQKRFAQRSALARTQARLAAQIESAWRSRNRRREAEWGDPEDLGLPTLSGGIGGHVGGKTWRDALCEWIPDQESVRVKTLIPSLFIRQECANPAGRKSQHDTVVAQEWTLEEKKTFIELFLQYPKNFARISASLPLKSTEQCVQFYYLNKQKYRLKQLVVSYRRAMAGQRRLTLQLQGQQLTAEEAQPAGSSDVSATASTASEKRRVGRPKTRRE